MPNDQNHLLKCHIICTRYLEIKIIRWGKINKNQSYPSGFKH